MGSREERERRSSGGSVCRDVDDVQLAFPRPDLQTRLLSYGLVQLTFKTSLWLTTARRPPRRPLVDRLLRPDSRPLTLCRRDRRSPQASHATVAPQHPRWTGQRSARDERDGPVRPTRTSSAAAHLKGSRTGRSAQSGLECSQRGTGETVSGLCKGASSGSVAPRPRPPPSRLSTASSLAPHVHQRPVPSTQTLPLPSRSRSPPKQRGKSRPSHQVAPSTAAPTPPVPLEPSFPFLHPRVPSSSHENPLETTHATPERALLDSERTDERRAPVPCALARPTHAQPPTHSLHAHRLCAQRRTRGATRAACRARLGARRLTAWVRPLPAPSHDRD